MSPIQGQILSQDDFDKLTGKGKTRHDLNQRVRPSFIPVGRKEGESPPWTMGIGFIRSHEFFGCEADENTCWCGLPAGAMMHIEEDFNV